MGAPSHSGWGRSGGRVEPELLYKLVGFPPEDLINILAPLLERLMVRLFVSCCKHLEVCTGEDMHVVHKVKRRDTFERQAWFLCTISSNFIDYLAV